MMTIELWKFNFHRVFFKLCVRARLVKWLPHIDYVTFVAFFCGPFMCAVHAYQFESINFYRIRTHTGLVRPQ